MDTKLKSFILSALLFGSLSVVQAQVNTDSVSASKKLTGRKDLDGRWFLVPVLESDTSTGRIPEIQFDLGNSGFSGNTGCNRMSGSFLATDSSLHFSDKMMMTKMFCSGYNETAFVRNLLRTDGYKFSKKMLILTVQGVEVSRWNRKIVHVQKTGKT